MRQLLIYILLSIKTRIETRPGSGSAPGRLRFISYYPLKQGLKHVASALTTNSPLEFISYYPLKQGLKRSFRYLGLRRFRYLYPTIH